MSATVGRVRCHIATSTVRQQQRRRYKCNFMDIDICADIRRHSFIAQSSQKQIKIIAFYNKRSQFSFKWLTTSNIKRRKLHLKMQVIQNKSERREEEGIESGYQLCFLFCWRATILIITEVILCVMWGELLHRSTARTYNSNSVQKAVATAVETMFCI